MTLPTIITAPVQSNFAFNAVAGRYIDLSTGRFISSTVVRDELELAMQSSKDSMKIISQQLIDSNMSLAEWQTAMMEHIKNANLNAAMSANGGWAQMSQSDWGFVGQRIKEQYKYLNNYANQIYTGEQGLNGQILVRSNMYGDAARGTFEAMRLRYQLLENGMTEERRVLGAADHCNGCLEQAALGWQPIGTLDEIGDEECLTNCHCTKQYRRQEADGSYTESEEE